MHKLLFSHRPMRRTRLRDHQQQQQPTTHRMRCKRRSLVNLSPPIYIIFCHSIHFPELICITCRNKLVKQNCVLACDDVSNCIPRKNLFLANNKDTISFCSVTVTGIKETIAKEISGLSATSSDFNLHFHTFNTSILHLPIQYDTRTSTTPFTRFSFVNMR